MDTAASRFATTTYADISFDARGRQYRPGMQGEAKDLWLFIADVHPAWRLSVYPLGYTRFVVM